ncbi:hypothetical protein ACTXT7_006062 [Hymenolepis weldensis]
MPGNFNLAAPANLARQLIVAIAYLRCSVLTDPFLSKRVGLNTSFLPVIEKVQMNRDGMPNHRKKSTGQQALNTVDIISHMIMGVKSQEFWCECSVPAPSPSFLTLFFAPSFPPSRILMIHPRLHILDL